MAQRKQAAPRARLLLLLLAGAAKLLKDGDIVQFGTDTKVRVEVSAGGCCRDR